MKLHLKDTADSYPTLFSERFKETFHNERCGAYRETIGKFINTSELESFTQKKLHLLEVGLGMGYNLGALLDQAQQLNISTQIHTLDISTEPLKIALNQKIFFSLFSPLTLEALEEVSKTNKFFYQNREPHPTIQHSMELFIGDARQTLSSLPQDHYHLIFFDPFSPLHCPELWTEEFLQALSEKLTMGGRLITYGASAALRATLTNLGLKIFSIKPPTDMPHLWSWGTVAFKQEQEKSVPTKAPYKELSTKEKEHLKSRAAIPYRDPSGKDSCDKINHRRKIEQKKSQLVSSSSWRKSR